MGRLLRLVSLSLMFASLVGFVLTGLGTMHAQDPPIGNPPEAEDDLQRQIADFLLSGQGAGVEENPGLWALIDQLEPDNTLTLGGGLVGGLGEDISLERISRSGSTLLIVVAGGAMCALLAMAALWLRSRMGYRSS